MRKIKVSNIKIGTVDFIVPMKQLRLDKSYDACQKVVKFNNDQLINLIARGKLLNYTIKELQLMKVIINEGVIQLTLSNNCNYRQLLKTNNMIMLFIVRAINKLT